MGAPKHKGVTQYGACRFPLAKAVQVLILTPFTISLYYLIPLILVFAFLRPHSIRKRTFVMSKRALALRRTAMSPYRQSPFRGVFSGYLFHGARRLAANAPYFVPPFAAGKPAFSTQPLAIAIAMH